MCFKSNIDRVSPFNIRHAATGTSVMCYSFEWLTLFMWQSQEQNQDQDVAHSDQFTFSSKSFRDSLNCCVENALTWCLFFNDRIRHHRV